MLRKNVSISDAHLRLLDPLLKKHQGNLSAAMRDIIDFTGFVTENMGSLEKARDLLKEKNRVKEQTLHRIYGITIPLTMFRWLLADRKTCLPSLNNATQLFTRHDDINIDDINIYDVQNLNNIFDEELSFLNWPVKVTFSSDNGKVGIQITGMDQEINKFCAILVAMFFSKNKNPQKISILMIYPASIYMGITEAISSEEAILTIHKKISNQDIIQNLDQPMHIES
ncbi:MAG: hypothetical protein KKI06_00595 [Euryarchaeota archaeon]|nr:hypothetical protein [Euryarchaeota archaeon]